MSQMNAGISYPKSTQSIAFKFFSESFKELEKQISNNADSNLFTEEQVDFIVLICDQFEKLLKLRHKNKFIGGLLSHHFPELFKLLSQNNAPNLVNPINNPIDQSRGNKFTFSCDVCDEEILIVNHDLNYSTQLHINSPYHLEVVSILRKIKEAEISTNLNGSSTTNLTTNFRPETNVNQYSYLGPEMNAIVPTSSEFYTSTVSDLQTLQQSKPFVAATSSISKGEESFQGFTPIKDLKRRSRYRNNLKLACTLGISSTISNGNISNNDQNSEITVTKNGIRICKICNVHLSEANFLSHINSISHKNEVAKRAESNSNTAVNSINNALSNNGGNTSSSTSVCTSSNTMKNQTVTTSNDNSIVRRGEVLYCSLCNVILTGKSQVDSHTNGSRHKNQLMIDASPFDFIIYKKGKRYCSLCDAQLQGESQFNGHINSSSHKSKVLAQKNLK